MNPLRKMINWLYPARIKFSKLTGLGIDILVNQHQQLPVMSFYSLQATNNQHQLITFDQYKNKHVLICNLASFCGYTHQYEELETLYQQYQDRLVILGFPSNDFGGQEPGTDDEIAAFCKRHYGVSFPLFTKDHVSGAGKQPVFEWLSNAAKNGWNDREPNWNFCKYLVDTNGTLTHFFTSAVSPLDEVIIHALK